MKIRDEHQNAVTLAILIAALTVIFAFCAFMSGLSSWDIFDLRYKILDFFGFAEDIVIFGWLFYWTKAFVTKNDEYFTAGNICIGIIAAYYLLGSFVESLKI
jgi:hypothetical protein